MAVQFILADYVSQLLAYAVYDKLDDGTYAGRIPQCKGLVAFGATLRECEDEIHSVIPGPSTLSTSNCLYLCHRLLLICFVVGQSVL